MTQLGILFFAIGLWFSIFLVLRGCPISQTLLRAKLARWWLHALLIVMGIGLLVEMLAGSN